MADEEQTIEGGLRDVEAELCRLPDVLAARIVADAQRARRIDVEQQRAGLELSQRIECR